MPEDGYGIGAAVKRTEDWRFLRGEGQYTDDISLPNQAYAHVLRSPHAHAEITSLDVEAAQAIEGVFLVLTSNDFAELGGLPCGWQIHSRDGSPMAEPKHPVLAESKVRHVGDPIAVVVAVTLALAKEAADSIEVNFKELPAIVDMAAAQSSRSSSVHENVSENLCFDWELGDLTATEAAFRNAAHITELKIINNRLAPVAIETRCAIGDFHQGKGDLTLYTTSQAPHVIRLLMGAFVLQIPENKIRVVAPDVGGGFGSKIYHYAEEVIVCIASRKLGRPVKWTSDRSEAFVSDAQGRDHITEAALALDGNGKFTGLRVSTLANLGAYLSTFSAVVPTYLHGTLLAGQYTTPAIYINVKAVFTNTVPVDAYRGAGRPEATFLLERLVDAAAKETGRDPVMLRRLNFIKPDEFPYETPVALTYDTGNYEATLDQALDAVNYAGLGDRKEDARKRGKRRGLGLATYIEACGIAPSAVAGALGARAGLYEAATVRVNPTGSITVFIGSHSHGQGHETTFAQIVSDQLSIPFDHITIEHGDTANVPFGMGTYGSRSVAVGGSALSRAIDKIIAKGKKIAAHMMEAAEQDISFEDGAYKVIGTDRQKTFSEIAFSAYVPHHYPLEELEPGLEETAFYDPANFTYPAGTHICEVEVDPETGTVQIARFHASDDFGRIINPMIVAGQVHGGLAQGIGQALLENCVYDDNGQLISGSLLDYCLPRADNLPTFSVDTTVTECTHNPLGVKGCGEAGAIGAPAAVINAVVDALSEYGVKDITMPVTPEKVWRAIHKSP